MSAGLTAKCTIPLQEDSATENIAGLSVIVDEWGRPPSNCIVFYSISDGAGPTNLSLVATGLPGWLAVEFGKIDVPIGQEASCEPGDKVGLFLVVRSEYDHSTISQDLEGIEVNVQIQTDDCFQNHYLRLLNIEPVTSAFPDLQIEKRQNEKPLRIGEAEFQADQEIAIATLEVTQPRPRLAHSGHERSVTVSAKVQCAFSGASLPISAQITNSNGHTVSDAERGIPDAFVVGKTMTYDLSVRASAIDWPAPPDNVDHADLKINWMVAFEDEAPEPVIMTRRITLRQGELVAIRFGEHPSVTPTMLTTPPVVDDLLPGRVNISKQTRAFSLSVCQLSSKVDTLRMSFRLSEGGPELETVTPIDIDLSDLAPGEFKAVQIEFKAQSLNDALSQGSDENELVIALQAEKRELPEERFFGALHVGITARPQTREVIGCLDFGASSSAFYLMRSSDDRRTPLALGDFAFSLIGKHAEYVPSATVPMALLPMAVSLSSDAHMRSEKDPLSLVHPDFIGTEENAVRKRLEFGKRSYDVSIPCVDIADASGHTDRTIKDLKRRFISPSTLTLPEVWRKDGSSVSKVRQIDFDNLLHDVFSELGSYVLPRALVHSGGDRDQAEVWLDMNLSNLSLVFTHPCGLAEDRLKAFKSAAQRFAKHFTGQIEDDLKCQLKFVPEALAAAYYCIEQYRANDPQGTASGHRTYACLDVGAGTLDATLLTVEHGEGGYVKSWEIDTHFGAPVGGQDLDSAILGVALSALDSSLAEGGELFESHEYYPDIAADPARRKAEVAKRIDAAKKVLSEVVRKHAADTSTAYSWNLTSLPSAFDIDLAEIVRTKSTGGAGHPRKYPTPSEQPDIHLDPTTGAPRLSIPKDALRVLGDFDLSDIGRTDPRSVVALLGRAVPAMLAREAKRRNRTDVTWFVTGRTPLWPPLFETIAETVRSTGVGALADTRPFSAAQMKTAVVEGAISLSQTNLDLSDRETLPLAWVRRVSAMVDELSMQSILRLEEVRYLDNLLSSTPLPVHDWSLAHVLPGLQDDTNSPQIGRNQIEELFREFDLPTVLKCETVASYVENTATGQILCEIQEKSDGRYIKIGNHSIPLTTGRIASRSSVHA